MNKSRPYYGTPCKKCSGESFNGTIYHKTWCPTITTNWSKSHLLFHRFLIKLRVAKC